MANDPFRPEPLTAPRPARALPIGAGVIALIWATLTVLAMAHGLWSLSALTTLQAAALIAGAALAQRVGSPRAGGLLDAAAVGILLASVGLYVLPDALHGHAGGGATGFVAGLFAGGLVHRAAGRAVDRSMLATLGVHAASAGVAFGLVYQKLPAVGLALGVAILAHKLPAGYALARALRAAGRSPAGVVWPACAVGLTALPIALWLPVIELPHGALLGFAGGLFVVAAATFALRLRWRDVRTLACLLVGAALPMIAHVALRLA